MNIATFIKFLARHAIELKGLTSVVSTLLGAIPIQRDEKAKLQNVLDAVAKASENIIASLPALERSNKVVIKKTDIEAAVASVLPGIVAKAVKAELDKREKKNA